MKPTSLRERDLRRLLFASERLHALDEGPFAQRLFRASQELFSDCVHCFEVYGLTDGSHHMEDDAPWSEAERIQQSRRVSELVPLEHPAFPRLRAGHLEPTRLSDAISRTKWMRTELYAEVFRPLGLRSQILIPWASPTWLGGLTINRDADFTDRELALAHQLAAHVRIAYRTDRIVAAARSELPEAASRETAHLQGRGLSPREAEVLFWVTRGKRNQEISIILGVTPRTVEVHLTAVYRKLDVDNRAAAVAQALGRDEGRRD